MIDAMTRFARKWAPGVDGCHVWFSCATKEGYGKFHVNGRTIRAHRWLYQTAHRLTDDQMPVEVLHMCDNPACVNERHLAPGTKSDNMRDMVAKGRGRNQFGARE